MGTTGACYFDPDLGDQICETDDCVEYTDENGVEVEKCGGAL